MAHEGGYGLGEVIHEDVGVCTADGDEDGARGVREGVKGLVVFVWRVVSHDLAHC